MDNYSAPACQSRDSLEDIWGPRDPYYQEWPTRVDYAYDEEPDKWVQSACVLCRYGPFDHNPPPPNGVFSDADSIEAMDALWMLV
jgi:hypothetical protein